MIPYRIARELVYQLDRSHQQERLATMLSTIQMFVVLYRGETREEVLMLWKKLTDAGHDLVEAYQRSMDVYRSEGQSDESLTNVLKKLGGLLEVQSYWPAAEEMMRELLEVAVRLNDRGSEAWAHRALGGLARWQGRYEEAMQQLEHALTIAQSAGDRLTEASVIGNMGNVYINRGEYDRALECYDRHQAISEELGDRRGLSNAIGNMGIVYRNHGEYDRALECYDRHQAISEELGDRRGLSAAIGNMGRVYSDRGEYDLALVCLKRSRAICEELGDRHGLSNAIGSMGTLYDDRGEYDRALECYERQQVICEELGNQSGLSYAIGNMGVMYRNRGEYDRALECLQTALEGHHAIGALPIVTAWLEGLVRVILEVMLSQESLSEYVMSYVGAEPSNWRESALVLAREHADECLKISEQLQKPDTLFSARLLLARIDAAEGKTVAAVEQLTTMLAEAMDDEQRAELQYWLWKLPSLLPLFSKIKNHVCVGVGGSYSESVLPDAVTPSNSPFRKGGGPEEGEQHRVEALRLYEQLLAKTPKHEFKKRIEELTTGGITA